MENGDFFHLYRSIDTCTNITNICMILLYTTKEATTSTYKMHIESAQAKPYRNMPD